MRSTVLLVPCLLLATVGQAQCDTTAIDHDGWTIPYFDSEEATGEGATNGHAIHCIDGDSLTFWHTEWQAADPPFPHEIRIDLGAVRPVNGISLLSRSGTDAGKAKDFVLYLSLDGSNWGEPQAVGSFQYDDPGAGSQRGNVYFGAVDAQHLRLVVQNNYQGTAHLMVAEFDVFELSGPGCAATGQMNQLISIDPVATQTTTSGPITLVGSASSGLPVSFEVVSGPATVQGNTLTLDGTAGVVTVRALQAGDAAWYPASAATTFDVLDLANYHPMVTTKLTDAFPVQMPDLHAYALYANASIDEPDFNTITSVVFNVNGETLPTTREGTAWLAWWTPTNYGAHTITATATASNGNTATESVNVTVTDQVASQTAPTFDAAVIDLGTIGSQWYTGSYSLPQSVGAYSSITAHLDVSCPSVPGGCDDWDRLAWIEVKAPNGEWVELIRYVTPYGVACDHQLDVTDFASILQGNVELRMYIETWGTGGWKIDLDFAYQAGVPDHLYTTVQRVWRGTYNFGDPADLQPVDTVSISPAWNAAAASLRLVTTGHGWGSNNTGNAAEFYHATHHVYANGQPFVQDLWNICNPNPDGCSPQYGTWQYNRAGWCPGTIAPPFSYDLTAQLNGAPIQLAYTFQESYVDNCHPNNPNCISGVTCADCSASYNPHYPISAYLISKGDTPLHVGLPQPAAEKTPTVSIRPNPTNGPFQLDLNGDMGRCTVTVHDISGATLKTWYFGSRDHLGSHSFPTAGLASGTYFVKVQSETVRCMEKLVVP